MFLGLGLGLQCLGCGVQGYIVSGFLCSGLCFSLFGVYGYSVLHFGVEGYNVSGVGT